MWMKFELDKGIPSQVNWETVLGIGILQFVKGVGKIIKDKEICEVFVHFLFQMENS